MKFKQKNFGIVNVKNPEKIKLWLMLESHGVYGYQPTRINEKL